MRAFLLMLCVALSFLPRLVRGQTTTEPDTVTVHSKGMALRALLWRPPGKGPFPAVLFNHGSGHGVLGPSGAIEHTMEWQAEAIAPAFVRHGYVFFAPLRRGTGLSADQGTNSSDRWDSALVARGQDARNRLQVELLESVELDDALAGLAFLRARPEVDARRVGIWGISQGGWPASVLAASDSSLAFVILHAGSSLTPAVQGEDEMRMRVIETGGTQGDIDDLLAYYRHYLDVLRGGTNRESLDELYRALRAKGNRYIWSPAVATSARERWQRGINDFDPVPYWSTARVPVLALFGEFDGYVTPEANVPVLRAAFARSGNRDTTIVVFPRANHRIEESSRRVSNDWVIGSRYLPDYYNTMALWLDRHLTRKR